MNLHQLLSHFSYEQLQLLSDEYGIVSMSPSTRNMAQSILEKYRNSAFMAQLLSELPDSCRGFLQTLILLYDRTSEAIPFPATLLSAWSMEEPEEALHPLTSKGLLFLPEEQNSDHIILPADLRETLMTLLRPKRSAIAPVSHSPLRHEPVRNAALDALFHLLSLLEHYKAPITQKGAVHRKVYEAFCKRFHQTPPAERYFQRLIQFALRQELLTERNKSLHSSPNASAWFALREQEMISQIWQSFLYTTLLEKPLYQQFIIFFISMYEGIDDTLPHFSLDEILEEFEHRITPSEQPNPMRNAALECIESLEFIGFLNQGLHEGKKTLSLSSIGAEIIFSIELDHVALEPEPCMMQPNFDLLIPPSIGYETLWRIEQIAEYARRDVMTQYHLSQNSIMHAMRRNWNQESIIQLLHQLTEGRLAQNVIYSLEEWCDKYGEIQLQRVLLVECNTAELAEELTHIPEIHTLFNRRISDRHFAVTDHEMKLIRKTLQERGYEPAMLKSHLTPDE